MKGAIKGLITAAVLVIVFMSGDASGSMHSFDPVTALCAQGVDCNTTSIGPSGGWTVDWELPWFGDGGPVRACAGSIDLEEIRRSEGPSIIQAWGAPDGFNAAVIGHITRDKALDPGKSSAYGR